MRGGLGDDGIIDGGDGLDTFSYDDGRANGVTVILDNGDAEHDGGLDDNSSATSREAIVGFERIIGSDQADHLTGDAEGNTIDGQGGDDTLVGDNPVEGAGTKDELLGGPGDDTITRGDGDDNIFGGADDDTLDGEAHGDVIDGDAGVDTVDYSARTLPLTVVLDSGDGDASDFDSNELPSSGPSDDVEDTEVVLGGSRDDELSVARNASTAVRLKGNAGRDELRSGAGADTLIGGPDADTLVGEDGADSLFGGGGADSLTGGEGNDALHGDAGGDALSGGADRDTASYTGRAEAITASIGVGTGDDGGATDGAAGSRDTVAAGVEVLVGGSGADTLIGDAAANELEGRAGDDTLRGGIGADVLKGGPNRDTVDYADRTAAQPVDVSLDGVLNRSSTPWTPRRAANLRRRRRSPRPPRTARRRWPSRRPPPAAPQLIPATIAYEASVGRSFTKITRLYVRNPVTDSTVTVRCKSRSRKGCPARSLTKRGSFAVVRKEFVGKRLPVGTTLTIRVTAPGWVGVIKTMTVRKSRSPLIRTQCLPQGAAKPGPC